MNTAIEKKARRAAKHVELVARKSRCHESIDNFGEFMLIDPRFNIVVAGSRYDMTPEEVIEYCAD